MFRLGLSGRLWPIHPKPYEEELLSSWLARIAIRHGMGARFFSKRIFGKQFPCDVDNLFHPKIWALLAESTNTPIDRVQKTTILDYQGRCSINGKKWDASWVSRKVMNYNYPWIRFCPQCLKEDREPYYRRYWRLSFITLCPIHQCLLSDRCPNCDSLIDYLKTPVASESLTICYSCQHDIRVAEKLNLSADQRDLFNFQSNLLAAFEKGTIHLSGEGHIPVIELLFVMKRLTRPLLWTHNSSNYRREICSYLNLNYFKPSFKSFPKSVENLRIEDQSRTMLLINKWMNPWPNQFEKTVQVSKIRKIELAPNVAMVPEWFGRCLRTLYG